MNLYLQALMAGTDTISDRCTWPGCGSTYRLENHHVVERSQGGTDGPRRTLCWNHHEPFRLRRAFLRWSEETGWECLETAVEMKYERALEMDGWRPL